MKMNLAGEHAFILAKKLIIEKELNNVRKEN